MWEHWFSCVTYKFCLAVKMFLFPFKVLMLMADMWKLSVQKDSDKYKGYLSWGTLFGSFGIGLIVWCGMSDPSLMSPCIFVEKASAAWWVINAFCVSNKSNLLLSWFMVFYGFKTSCFWLLYAAKHRLSQVISNDGISVWIGHSHMKYD